MDDYIIADDAHMAVAFDHAIGNHAACNVAHFGHGDDLADFHRARLLFLFFGREHPAHRGFHIVNRVVNNVVVADFHVFIFGQFAGGCIARTLKPMMNAPEAIAKLTSLSVMPPTPLCRTCTRTSSVDNFLQAARECFVGTLYVCLDDDRQVLHLAFAHVTEHVLQLGGLLFG